MKIYFTTIFFALFMCLGISAQTFPDSIFTNKTDTILCKITLVNNQSIFYKFNPKKKRIEHSLIALTDVKRYTLEDQDVILEFDSATIANLPKPAEIGNGWIEDNGLIYASNIDTPPKFKDGVMDLNIFLENNVRVNPADKRVFGSNAATVLYRVYIDESGKISGVAIDRTTASTGGFSYNGRLLEEEIGAVISTMPNWSPAIVDGKNTAISFYLPIRFKLNSPRIYVLSSRHLFIFGDRE